MSIRVEYQPVKAAVEAAGFFVTSMPLEGGGDRIVCAGLRRPAGGYTGKSFWLAERGGKWFLGAWGGFLYRIADAEIAAEVAVAWLRQNCAVTDANRCSSARSANGARTKCAPRQIDFACYVAWARRSRRIVVMILSGRGCNS